jgi:hypothetical protein
MLTGCRGAPERERVKRTKERRLRIAMLAPPWIPVPPRRYGGVEFVVALLSDALWTRATGRAVLHAGFELQGEGSPATRRGGALVDLRGQVVGIPTLAATDPELGGGAAPGLPFVVTSALVPAQAPE